MHSPLGSINLPVYDALVTSARESAAKFKQWQDDEDSYQYIQNTLRPILLDFEGLQQTILYSLNSGLLQEKIRERMATPLVLPRYVEDFAFIKRFLKEDHWGDRTLPRIIKTHAMPESLYLQSLDISQKSPLISRTMQAIQDVISSHFANISNKVTPPTDNKTEIDVVAWTIDQICKAAETTFLEELMPFVSLSADFHAATSTTAPVPIEHIFSRGLKQSFNAQAFQVRKATVDGTNSTILKCPFTPHMGRLWNMNIVKNDRSHFELLNEPKTGAFPAMIAGLVRQNDIHNTLSP